MFSSRGSLCARHFTYTVPYLITRGDLQYKYTKWQVLSTLTYHEQHRDTKDTEVGVAYPPSRCRSSTVFASFHVHSKKRIFAIQKSFGGD